METKYSLGILGLGVMGRSLAQNFADLWEVSLTLDIQEGLEKLTTEVEQAYYRVAQEALDNIARHAEAHAAALSLTRAGSRLTLTVSDDGRGIASGADFGDDHFGIQGMRERAALIGGMLEIEAHPGQGTMLRLTTKM